MSSIERLLPKTSEPLTQSHSSCFGSTMTQTQPRNLQPLMCMTDKTIQYTQHNVCMIIHFSTDGFLDGFIENKCTQPGGELK